MIEFGNQHAQLLLGAFAFGDVDVDANHALRAPVLPVGNETAGLEPSMSAAGPDNSIFHTNLSPPIEESLAPDRFDTLNVFRMRSDSPFAAFGLSGTLGQTVESGIAFVNLHAVNIDVIGIAADE